MEENLIWHNLAMKLVVHNRFEESVYLKKEYE